MPPAVPAAYRAWVAVDRYPSPAADVRLAARCMLDLLGGGRRHAAVAAADPAVVRHLDRAAHAQTADAWQLRAEFDQLIDTLWGPRRFRPLTMPPRRHSV